MMWSAFILGLLGSLHCAAMCGPFMLGLSTKEYSVFSLIIHHLGRWTGYILLAVLFYFIVSPLQIFEMQQYVGVVSGVLLMIYALKSYLPLLDRMFGRITALVSNRMLRTKTGRKGSIILGILNGLLPCGLSFGAAILSVNAGRLIDAAAYMVMFGLGTLPILLSMSYVPQLILKNIIPVFNRYSNKTLLIVGFLLILRSSGLGIPYLSPHYDVAKEKMECCEH